MKRRLRKKCPLCSSIVLKLSNHLIQLHKLEREERTALLKHAVPAGSPKILLKKWEKTLLAIDSTKSLRPPEVRAVHRLSSSIDATVIRELQASVKRHVRNLLQPDTFKSRYRQFASSDQYGHE